MGEGPVRGKVEIQRASGNGWRTVGTLGIGTGKVRSGSGSQLRAAIGGATSLSRRPR